MPLSTGRSSLDCPSYMSAAGGLCLAKGQDFSTCSNISLAGALNAGIPGVDWAWDRFHDAKGNVQMALPWQKYRCFCARSQMLFQVT